MAAAADNVGRKEALENAISQALLSIDGVDSLRDEQFNVLDHFLFGNDVMGLLPTGFGKSLTYQVACPVAGLLKSSPQCPDRLKTAEHPMVIVLSPLVALIRDQVKEARRLGISAVSLTDASPEELRQVQMGKFQLVFGNPETWILTSKWRDMLKTDVFQQNLIGIVVDEAHKTPMWGEAVKKGGEAFRSCFARVSELRSLCPQATPVLALTASADLTTRKDIVRLLCMNTNTIYVEGSPDRPNIRLGVVRVKASDFSCFDWIVSGLKEKQSAFHKVIIYCRSFSTVGAVYGHLVSELGASAHIGVRHSDNCLVAIYHSETLQDKKDHVMSSFGTEHSTARVIVATTALSMGINFPDVKYVVMYGPPENMEDLLQQVGRAGRTGEQAHAVIYNYSVYQCNKQVKQYVQSDNCLRTGLYSRFESKPTTKPVSPGHLCCSICHLSCKCVNSERCEEGVPIYECKVEVGEAEPPLKRVVDQQQKDVLREALYEYRDSLTVEKKLLVSIDLTTGFTSELIDSVIEHSPHIFDAKYVYDNLPVYTLEHAKAIADIVQKVFDDHLDIDNMIDFIQKEFHKTGMDLTDQGQTTFDLDTSSSGSSSDELSYDEDDCDEDDTDEDDTYYVVDDDGDDD